MIMKGRVTAKRGDNERVSWAKHKPSHPLATLSCQFTYSRALPFLLFLPLPPPRPDNLGNQYSTGASIRKHSVPSCRHYCCHHFGLVIKPAVNVPARLSPLCHSATFAAQTKNRFTHTKTARGRVRQTICSRMYVREKEAGSVQGLPVVNPRKM